MFNAVRVWIEHSRHDRMKVAGQLMGCVRFLHMPPEEIVRHVEPNVAYFAGLGGHDVLLGIYRCVGSTGGGVCGQVGCFWWLEGGGSFVRSFCFCLMSSDAKSILGTTRGGGWTGGPVFRGRGGRTGGRFQRKRRWTGGPVLEREGGLVGLL